MGPRMVNLAPAYIVIAMILIVVPSTIGQQPQPSQTELQSILFLQDLMKVNPGIKHLVQAAATLPNNITSSVLQGVTMNPLLSVVFAGLQNVQNPFTSVSNQSSSSNNATSTTGTLDTSSVLQQALQNPLLSNVISAVIEEVQTGLVNAEANNITVDSNITSLLALVDPLSVIRKVAVTGFVKSQFPNQPGVVNPSCYRDVMDSVDALSHGKDWAIKMFDAMGKPNSGVERGSLYFVGSYDECNSIEARVEKTGLLTNTIREFDTKHCRVDISIPKALVDSFNVDTRGVHLKLTWGLCVPASCQSHDVRGLFKLGQLNRTNLNFENVICQQDKDLGNDKSAIAAVTVLSFFGLMVLVGTVYDGCRAFNKPVDSVMSQVSSEKSNKTNIHSNGVSTQGLGDPTNNDQNHESLPKDNTNINQLSPEKPMSVEFHSNGVSKQSLVNTTNNEQQEPVRKEEDKVELPRGYTPHREGPTIPMPTSVQRPVTTDAIYTNCDVNHTEQQIAARPGDVERKRRDPLIIRVLLCFSLYSNVPKILQAKSGPGSITCVHGIRFLSLMWVILGHTYNYGIISNEGTFTADNLLDFEPILQRFTFQGVMAGGYAVDTFFVLSGFLLTWIQLKEADKRRKKVNLNTGFMYYFHRFWRLTPIYMIVLMSYTCLYRYLGSGPFWPSAIEAADNCKDVWWTNMLYINNLVKTDTQCMGWSWYLANDMQFYVISPIFISAMYMFTMPGALFTSMLMVMGVAIAFWKEYVSDGNFLTMLSDGGDYWTEVYTVPWCRVGCWAVGMLLGLVIFKRGKRPIKNTKLYLFGWILATGVALFLVYITHTYNKKDGEAWTNAENALYESFGRTLWGICIAWVIFACHTGKGGLVNSILSWNGLIPLSRLTYAAYLVHPVCMQVYAFSRRNLFHVDDYNMIYLFLGHSCIAFMVAFVCSLAFEAPFMALEKVMFPTRRH